MLKAGKLHSPGDPFLVGQGYVVGEVHPFLSTGINLGKNSSLGKVPGLNNNMAAADWDLSWYQSGGECPDAPGQLCSASHMTLAGVSLAGASGGTASNGNSNIVYRKTGTGSGWVFSIGSLSSGGVLAIDPTLQRVVQNAFDAAIAGVAPGRVGGFQRQRFGPQIRLSKAALNERRTEIAKAAGDGREHLWGKFPQQPLTTLRNLSRFESQQISGRDAPHHLPHFDWHVERFAAGARRG
jgi:hypothetical protein